MNHSLHGSKAVAELKECLVGYRLMPEDMGLHGSKAVAELKVVSGMVKNRKLSRLHGSKAVAELKVAPRCDSPGADLCLHGSKAVAELKGLGWFRHGAPPIRSPRLKSRGRIEGTPFYR